MNNYKPEIESILKSKSKSDVSTADVAIGMISSSELSEKTNTINDLINESNRQLIISIISGDSYLICCETCYSRKGNRFGGAAITSWNCAKCGSSQSSGSTAHERLCLGCALQYKKCVWCNYNDNMLVDYLKGSK